MQVLHYLQFYVLNNNVVFYWVFLFVWGFFKALSPSDHLDFG